MVQKLRIFRRAVRTYREHVWATVLGSLAVVASALVGLLAPGVVRGAIDALSARAPLATLWLTAAKLLAISLTCGLLLFAQRRLLVGVSRHLEHRLRTDLYQHLLRLPARVFMRERVGDLLTRAMSDVGTVRMAVGPAYMYALNTVTALLASVVLMAQINPLLTGLALAVLPLVASATRFFGARIHTAWARSQESLSRYTARLQEHLVGLRVLRAFTCEESEVALMEARNREYVAASARLIGLQAVFHPLLQALIGSSFVIVLLVGGRAVRAGSMSLGQFVEFNLYLVRLIWPMIAIGWVTNLVQRGTASMGRIEQLFSEPAQEESAPVTLSPTASGPAALEIVDVAFTYPGAGHPAVDGVSLTLRPGQRAALVGPVGSGKSTLLSLIPRLIETGRGTIRVDGRDVRATSLSALRGELALVPQISFLFSASLRDNIALARPQATREEVLAAALAAGLGDDLARLAAGLDTIVGERGVTLSGGQRQRVAIARAILARPRMLLFDDCLSAVDTQTERLILDSLPATTVLFATHRLAAVELCEAVYVLDRGRLVEHGAPSALAAAGGRYARLLALQRLEQPALAAAG